MIDAGVFHLLCSVVNHCSLVPILAMCCGTTVSYIASLGHYIKSLPGCISISAQSLVALHEGLSSYHCHFAALRWLTAHWLYPLAVLHTSSLVSVLPRDSLNFVTVCLCSPEAHLTL